MQVLADVSESDIGMCRVGQPVRFTVDAYPDETFRGKIAQIRLNATVNQNVVTYPVMIEVANPELALRPSMTANVSIDVATVKDVLRIPNAALRFRPEETEASAAAGGTSPEERAARGAGTGTAGAARQFDRAAGGGKPRRPGQTVYTIDVPPLGEPRPVEIKPGVTDGRYTQVAGGELREGELVVVGLVTAKADAAAGRSPMAGGPGRGRRF
jgi:HlyD family secretion protein